MIQQIDKNGNVIKEWDCSVSDIAREMGCNRSVLQLALSGKRPYCKGYIWRSATAVATDDATPSIEDATTDNLDATDATIETRSLPAKRMVEMTMKDIEGDEPDEHQRIRWNESYLTEKETEYLDWTWEQIERIPVEERERREKDRGYAFFPLDRRAFEWLLSNHFEKNNINSVGFYSSSQPAKTIKRACELELFNCYMDRELQEFTQRFKK